MDKEEYSPVGAVGTLPRTTRGMPLVLGGDPKGNNFLYCNGNSVIIRNINNPSECEIYTEHSTLTTVAKYAPSGFYIASGDQSGKIRIWDTTQKTHLLKAEYQPIAGPIRDIAWSADSQRIAVVGEGRERFGHVFLFDTGTSNGSLTGQSKALNSVEFRDSRPFRIVTASEDYTVAIFEGPPFKFKTHQQIHTRFAHVARYQPGGALFASCGADGKVLLFDGVEGTPAGELVDPGVKGGNAHAGSVYCLSFSPDGQSLLTVSADKTAKIWNVGEKSLTSTFTLGSTVDEMQVGCLWQGDHILTVSLAGFITYLNKDDPSKPIRVLKGHNKPITALALTSDAQQFFTADSEGNICRWNRNGDAERLMPKTHSAQVQGLAIAGDALLAVSIDDSLSCTPSVLGESLPGAKGHTTPLKSQPRGISVSEDGSLSAVACEKELCIFKQGQLVASQPLDFEATCVGLHPRGEAVAVGGIDNKCRVYALSGTTASLRKELTHNGAITAVAWSPDGGILAVADAARRIVPYNPQDFVTIAAKDWTFHTAKVNCMAWSADGRRLASGSLDTSIIVWDIMQSGEHPIIIKGAHTMSQINKVAWLSPNEILSVGQDSNIKTWKLLV